jgi:hypothetical protein
VKRLWEQGLVDLYASASDYPVSFRLIPANASFRPVDAAHLHWLPGVRLAVALTGQAG